MRTSHPPLLDLLTNSLFSEVKASYFPNFKASERPKITCSGDAYKLLVDRWPDIDYCESFGVILLNRANRVIGLSIISTGGLSGTVADPKKVFQVALKTNSSNVILVHNHPSGSTTPSEADNKLTQKMKDVGIALDLFVIDHIIITTEKYYSFADEGHI